MDKSDRWASRSVLHIVQEAKKQWDDIRQSITIYKNKDDEPKQGISV